MAREWWRDHVYSRKKGWVDWRGEGEGRREWREDWRQGKEDGGRGVRLREGVEKREGQREGWGRRGEAVKEEVERGEGRVEGSSGRR